MERGRKQNIKEQCEFKSKDKTQQKTSRDTTYLFPSKKILYNLGRWLTIYSIFSAVDLLGENSHLGV